MAPVPAFEIGVWNAWIFMIIYPLQWLAVILAGRGALSRTGHPIDIETSKSVRRRGMAANILWIAATLYSIFLPFYLGTPWFFTGLALFVVGLAILIIGTISFAISPPDYPVTGYVFRYTRHPMYLSMFFIYLGVSIAAVSWLFFLITLATFFLMRLTALAEERYCLRKYGDAYRDYMDRTPRWIGIPKQGKIDHARTA